MAGLFLWQLICVSFSLLVFSQALSDGPTSLTTNKICNDDPTNTFHDGSLVQRFFKPTFHNRPPNRPYPTMSSNTKPYCFCENNKNGHYRSFDVQEWREALKALCGYSTLNPDDGFRSYVSPEGLVAWGAYAQDQSGCSKKSSFDFTESCIKWMSQLVEACDGSVPEEGAYGYGGGFVQPGADGCIEYYIAKS